MMIRNALEYLEISAKNYPDKIALEDEHEKLTYTEYITKAKTIGTYLLKKGLDKYSNKPVAVIIDRNIRSIVAFMGVLYTGNFYVPIDYTLPAERIQLIYDTLDPIAVIDARTDTGKAVEGAIDFAEASTGEEIDEELLRKVRSEAIDTDPIYGDKNLRYKLTTTLIK
jgi:acyl-CoA synthetase (AMP-forming)/AMP-acid ligase II